MPLQATSGAASYDAYGGGVAAEPNYIESCFSTYLYTGNGSATYNNQLIQNGLNLNADENLGRDFLIWTKARSSAENHRLYSPVAYTGLISNSTAASVTPSGWINSATNGYYLSTNASSFNLNTSNVTYASWTFRKQAKFFDVQTFTYPLSGSITIPHNLASTPGCVMVKVTDGVDNWYVYHRGSNNGTNPSNYILQLNTNEAQINNFASWITVGSTSITFPSGALNPGSSFVMYLFAHDAGGFGLLGTDNVISCGSYTGNGSSSGPIVNLGYEPQWIIIKNLTSSTSWEMYDNMRGVATGGNDNTLYCNASTVEQTSSNILSFTATGFQITNAFGNTNGDGSNYIYIAIRRGPMKVPTSGTSVFAAVYEGSTTPAVQTSFPVDFGIWTRKDLTSDKKISSRLQGAKKMYTNNTTEEQSNDANLKWDYQNGYKVNVGASGDVDINWVMRRAPSFFDEVCYTGTGSTPQNITHNLGVAPELMIIKSRSYGSGTWIVYAQPIWGTGIGGFSGFDLLNLNNNGNAGGNNRQINSTAPTASVFSVGYSGSTYPNTNNPGDTFVAYLFASCPGVSKVGSYTGTGGTQTINCGFTGGARFVLIKRTDSTGDWYVWDTARGIVSGNDPYLLLNSTAAEVTNTDYVDTYSAGFEISSTAPAAINASGGTFIFLAIA